MKENHAVTPSSKLGLISWCFFDWANSAYITLIAGFIFGPYITEKVAPSKVFGTELWSWTIGAVGIIVAICAPMLGAMIDQLHRRKPWLATFVIINIIATVLLCFTKPSEQWLWWGLLFFLIASVAFEFNQVIYNTLLYCIAPKKMLGRLSGWGWGSGYLGGLIALTIALLVFIKSGWIPHTNDWDIRAVPLFVAVWLAIFVMPLFLFTPDQPATGITLSQATRQGWATLKESFGHVRRNRHIFVYLIAHLFYMDGLNTLLAYSAIYASGVFDMSFANVVVLAIAINILAGIGATGFAWVDDWIGPRFVVCLSLIVVIIAVIVMLITHSIVIFWIFALIAGLFIGPMQSSSRSYMARIVPAHLATQLFGMYALSGRVTAFIGPILVGGLVALFHSQRVGLFGPTLMMAIGLIMMWRLPKATGRKVED